MPTALPASWHRALAEAIRDPDTLIDALRLPDSFRAPARQAAELFPLLVPRSYLRRMEPENPRDPLLLQVLPLFEETTDAQGFVIDAVGDEQARKAPGLLQKYSGRALLISTGACAVHCRYCFRRHYPYGEEPRRLDEWEPALATLAADPTIHEAILSGGDPWMLTDSRLADLLQRLSAIPHIARIRIHTRLPIVLPDRVTEELLELCTSQRPQVIVVIHANHPHEIADDCRDALQRLVRSGLPVLNQAVLLRGINDQTEVLADLCERLINVGVLPYYLHQLDRVAGTAHFEVPEETGRRLIAELRPRLPGYAVPHYVREIAGELSKTPL
jgi:EF-P beta-lysylation protein EpmB